jgi:hypothetical protein
MYYNVFYLSVDRFVSVNRRGTEHTIIYKTLYGNLEPL